MFTELLHTTRVGDGRLQPTNQTYAEALRTGRYGFSDVAGQGRAQSGAAAGPRNHQ